MHPRISDIITGLKSKIQLQLERLFNSPVDKSQL